MENTERIEQNLKTLAYLMNDLNLTVICKTKDSTFPTNPMNKEEIMPFLEDESATFWIEVGRGWFAMHALTSEGVSRLGTTSGVAYHTFHGEYESVYLYKLGTVEAQDRFKGFRELIESRNKEVRILALGPGSLIPAPFITYAGSNKPRLDKPFKGFEWREFREFSDQHLTAVKFLAYHHFGKVKDLPAREPSPPVCIEQMIPKAIRRFVVQVSAQLGTFRELVFLPLIAGVSTLVGKKLVVYGLENNSMWETVPIARFIPAYLSGTRKGKTTNAALRFLEEFEHEMIEEHAKKVSAMAGDIKDADREIRRLQKESDDTKTALTKLKARMGRLSSAEGAEKELCELVERIKDEEFYAKEVANELAKAKTARSEMNVPMPARLTTQNATWQRAEEMLSENPNGILYNPKEISGLLWQTESPDGEYLRNFLQNATDGDASQNTDRIKRGLTHVKRQILHVLGATQPDKLDFYLAHLLKRGKLTDGLIQRFLIFYSRERFKYDMSAVVGATDESVIENMRAIFNVLRALDPKDLGKHVSEKDGLHYITFEPKAASLYKTWIENNQKRVIYFEKKGYSAFAAFLSKMAHHVCTLALDFQLLEWAARKVAGESSPDCSQITEENLRLALEWVTLAEKHGRAIYSNVNQVAVVMAHQIYALIKAGKVTDGMRVRDMQQQGWQGFDRAEENLAGLHVLERCNILHVNEEKEQGKTGKPPKVIRINKVVLEKVQQESGHLAVLDEEDEIEMIDTEKCNVEFHEPKWITLEDESDDSSANGATPPPPSTSVAIQDSVVMQSDGSANELSVQPSPVAEPNEAQPISFEDEHGTDLEAGETRYSEVSNFIDKDALANTYESDGVVDASSDDVWDDDFLPSSGDLAESEHQASFDGEECNNGRTTENEPELSEASASDDATDLGTEPEDDATEEKPAPATPNAGSARTATHPIFGAISNSSTLGAGPKKTSPQKKPLPFNNSVVRGPCFGFLIHERGFAEDAARTAVNEFAAQAGAAEKFASEWVELFKAKYTKRDEESEPGESVA